MFSLIFSDSFEKSFSKIKDYTARKQIWKKIQDLEKRAPLGKKLKGNPFWSIHVNKYRIIYQIEDVEIILIDILLRKHGYKEL
ncbi:type II toxin-antitoxin system mRNA interferase toxin, RelE/StbE family [Candidatus Woesearchaeota archaeon]|nr:type II toxin-antitoxin system mRNA interferase toxin, RelE/StbE family [Candidatus Woesearchaeota archaeon]